MYPSGQKGVLLTQTSFSLKNKTDSLGRYMKVREPEIPERTSSEPDSARVAVRPWISPSIQTLPRLSDLTLQSGGIPGGGGTGGGGSTVVP
jgi:hypothetical protein